mmetsp:Transcript_9948/g.29140  ORF Transcript_9948/g.29140 Transcript_9948/m.29140 type:complete len:355 (-) Transcript_9948:153-1217(-)
MLVRRPRGLAGAADAGGQQRPRRGRARHEGDLHGRAPPRRPRRAYHCPRGVHARRRHRAKEAGGAGGAGGRARGARVPGAQGRIGPAQAGRGRRYRLGALRQAGARDCAALPGRAGGARGGQAHAVAKAALGRAVASFESSLVCACPPRGARRARARAPTAVGDRCLCVSVDVMEPAARCRPPRGRDERAPRAPHAIEIGECASSSSSVTKPSFPKSTPSAAASTARCAARAAARAAARRPRIESCAGSHAALSPSTSALRSRSRGPLCAGGLPMPRRRHAILPLPLPLPPLPSPLPLPPPLPPLPLPPSPLPFPLPGENPPPRIAATRLTRAPSESPHSASSAALSPRSAPRK